jgi:hypothetical protein
MQNNSKNNLDFENDSNLRDVQSNTITKSKPDSFYLAEVNKIMCDEVDTLVNDDSNKNIYYCYNNSTNKKLVKWTRVNDLWIPKHLTHTSEYKEVDGNVCKIMTESCDSYNPSQDCQMKCFLNDKTVKTYTANYRAFP